MSLKRPANRPTNTPTTIATIMAKNVSSRVAAPFWVMICVIGRLSLIDVPKFPRTMPHR